MREYEKVLTFWFGEQGEYHKKKKKWFIKDPKHDARIKKQFHATLKDAKNGKLASWLETPEGMLAFIILLDQFSRNIYRNKIKSFELDRIAQRISKRGIKKGFDKKIVKRKRTFFYMPLMHAENKKLQKESIRLFKSIDQNKKGWYAYAVSHKKIIDTFGRFPHRNKILRRKSTKREKAYLKEPGAGF